MSDDTAASNAFRDSGEAQDAPLDWPVENVLTSVFGLSGAFCELAVGGGAFGGQGGFEVVTEPLLHGFHGDGGEAFADVGRGPVS